MATASSTPSAPLQRTSILWRLLSQTIILTGFVIVVLATLSFTVARSMLERSVRSQMTSISSIAEDALEATLQRARERASLLSHHATVRAILAGRESGNALERLLPLLQREETSIRAMELYDARAVLRARAGDVVGFPEIARRGPYHRPIVSERGWEAYDVFTPLWEEGGAQVGFLAIRYDARAALLPLLTVVPSLGSSAQATLFLEEDDRVSVVVADLQKPSYLLSLGTAAEQHSASVLLKALGGSEGVERTQDYRGEDVLMAYRFLPSLGWAMAVSVDRDEALSDVRRLALSHALMGSMLLLLGGILAFLLGRQLTHPLSVLVHNVENLRPGHWKVRRSVRTGDEVETLDSVFVQLATRLRRVYEHQEAEIADRTADLQKQAAFDRAVLEQIDYGVFTVDRHARITGANPAACTLLELSADTLQGKSITDVLLLCGHRGVELPGEHPVLQSIRKKRSLHALPSAHVNLRQKDDTLLPIAYAISPLLVGRQLFGAVVVLQDMSEQRRLDYLKSEFISLASHQLRTPLSALRWYVELFSEEKGSLSTEQRSYLHEMDHAIARMVALLTSLLHAARLEDENVKPDMQEVDIAAIMRDMRQDCEPLAHEAGVRCTFDAPRKGITLITDPTLLRIVLQNLLSNAVKYSQGKPHKAVRFTLKERAHTVEISVRDEGVGIPTNEQKRVFQKFFRAKNVRKMDTDGNGLGLYITHSIVERLGGTISFQSTENIGSTFTVVLPKHKKRATKKRVS